MEKKLYICVTPFFPTPNNFRGPFVYDQVKAIERNSDFKVIVFVPTFFANQESDYEYEDVKVYRFPTIEMPSLIFNGLANKLNTHSFIKKIKELGIDPKDVKVAHGHTSMFAAYAIALKRQNPSVVTVVQHHDPDPFGLRNGRLITWKPNLYFKAHITMNLFKQIDIHLSISKYVERNLKLFPKHSTYDIEPKYLSVLSKLRNYKSFHPKKSIVLYNGVDTKLFYPNPIPHEKFTIGCVGNMGDWKDQITLIKAINVLKKEGITDLKVIMIGSGWKENQYHVFIADNGLSDVIEFRKEVKHKELPAIFNTFDLFVLPSFFEGFGCVFTEAAACGIPFITCKGQGAAEYIAPEEMNFWTIEPHDYIDLANKIKSYMNQRRKQHLIETYDIDILIQRYIYELEKTLG